MSRKIFNEATLSASVNIVFAGCWLCVISALSISKGVQINTVGTKSVWMCVFVGWCRSDWRLTLTGASLSCVCLCCWENVWGDVFSARNIWCLQCPDCDFKVMLLSQSLCELSGFNCRFTSQWPAATAQTRTCSQYENLQQVGGAALPGSTGIFFQSHFLWFCFLRMDGVVFSSELIVLCKRPITFINDHRVCGAAVTWITCAIPYSRHPTQIQYAGKPIKLSEPSDLLLINPLL